jgi:DNA-binding transcriptional LysR family regulator
MDLSHLRSFVTVAKFGHLTRAAETLHLSQPALSGHIKALEEELGVTLFERTPSGMDVTPAGQRLLAEAEQIMGAVQHLAHSAQELRGRPTGHLALGTVLDPALLRVGDLLVRARERFPEIELELHQVMSSDALARVRSGAFDASFYFGDRPEPDLCALALRAITYRVAIPIAWAGELRGASWEALAERPWIVAPEPSTHRRLVMKLFGDRLPARIIEADSESVINNLVESGVGISLLREAARTAGADESHYFVCPEITVTTHLWLVHAAERESDPVIAALRAVVDEMWPDAPDVGAPPAMPPPAADAITSGARGSRRSRP